MGLNGWPAGKGVNEHKTHWYPFKPQPLFWPIRTLIPAKSPKRAPLSIISYSHAEQDFSERIGSVHATGS